MKKLEISNNDDFHFFSASILIFAPICVFILPSSYGRLEMPMHRGFEAWEDDAFILP